MGSPRRRERIACRKAPRASDEAPDAQLDMVVVYERMTIPAAGLFFETCLLQPSSKKAKESAIHERILETIALFTIDDALCESRRTMTNLRFYHGLFLSDCRFTS